MNPQKLVNIFVLVRAVTYAAFFIGFVLVYLPARFLSWSGIVEPATTGASQIAGMIALAAINDRGYNFRAHSCQFVVRLRSKKLWSSLVDAFAAGHDTC